MSLSLIEQFFEQILIPNSTTMFLSNTRYSISGENEEEIIELENKCLIKDLSKTSLCIVVNESETNKDLSFYFNECFKRIEQSDIVVETVLMHPNTKLKYIGKQHDILWSAKVIQSEHVPETMMFFTSKNPGNVYRLRHLTRSSKIEETIYFDLCYNSVSKLVFVCDCEFCQ